MLAAIQVVIVLAILCNAVVFGTDAFSALVQRPALAQVSDDDLVDAMGHVHLYGDKRLSLPGTLGLVFGLVGVVLALIDGRQGAAMLFAASVVLLLVWLGVFMKVVAPINKALTAMATGSAPRTHARRLQRQSDAVLPALVGSQGLALAALAFGVILL